MLLLKYGRKIIIVPASLVARVLVAEYQEDKGKERNGGTKDGRWGRV